MKKKSKIITILLGTTAVVFTSNAQNPIIQTCYTDNPAPIVYNDTLYHFTGHDEDDADDRGFKMRDYKLYTTTDIENRTDRGTALNAKKHFKWSAGDANAAQVVYKNGRFYYYIIVHHSDPMRGVVALGVAVSDNPKGPYVDAIGDCLVSNDQTKMAN